MSRQFHGVAVRTDRGTVDGRNIAEATHRPTPLPVMMNKPGDVSGLSHVVGRIDEIGYVGGRTFVTGRITRQWAVKRLENGDPWFLQADVDQAEAEMEDFDSPAQFSTARLSGVHLGQAPAWAGTMLHLDPA